MNSPLHGRRVLLVEDEMIVAWALQDMLADLGCTVVGPAARLDQALALIAATPLDAAILDVNLDGEQSYPAADALAALGVPSLFSTGYARDSLREPYRAWPVLQKPFHVSELRQTLVELLTASEPGLNSARALVAKAAP